MILKSFDGKEIYVREWTNVNEPQGVIQIAHGMNEYSARYEKFARYLNSIGYIVVADDHRGHGETDLETLGYCRGDMFDDTVKDMACVAKHYKERYKGLKYILLGHSYGSFLSQRFIQKYARFLDGAILCGSGKNSATVCFLGQCISSIECVFKGEDAPSKLMNKIVFGGYAKKVKKGEWLSVDEENNARYKEDIYCSFTCSNNFFKCFMKNMKKLYTKKWCEGLNYNMPLFIISGTDDPVGNMSKGVLNLKKFYENCGMKSVSAHLIKNSRHEFLNEKQNYKEGYDKITEFLKTI